MWSIYDIYPHSSGQSIEKFVGSVLHYLQIKQTGIKSFLDNTYSLTVNVKKYFTTTVLCKY